MCDILVVLSFYLCLIQQNVVYTNKVNYKQQMSCMFF